MSPDTPPPDTPPTPPEPPDRVYLPVLGVTVAWYLGLGLLLLLWAMFFADGAAASDCAPNLVCDPDVDPRGAVAAAAPWFGLAAATSLMLSVVLRLLAETWRAVSCGTAAAVIGAGLSTILFDLLM
ncbi:hypothetical protein Afil01_23830 [Actinorhabdospora filicis]|uniref:Uncharacterized protein n=1 Tax=Actinorhabdospora filicis TaxID=1785913 RepID=A0A9W6SN14_9ACTN|nr:hypothetical protein [Actinorhabdospora filicis]GLZ77576.1 hypothetical protein Afil01_23830 [Actinorhabdospora filicis]